MIVLRDRMMRSCNKRGRPVKPLFFAAAILLLASAADARPSNAKIVHQFIDEVFVRRNVDAADRFLAADYVQHNCKVAGGLDGFKRSMRDWFASIPPMREQTLHLVVERDLVVAHNRLIFTKGDKSQSVEGFDLYRLKDGKIVEHWDSDSTKSCQPA
jgi:predicted SnoaL-like aldol condensation-catalyzing enzyme